MPKQVAFIGSRNLTQFSEEQINLYKDAVLDCVRLKVAIITGACNGADQLAAETALAAGGGVHLVLPWPNYEQGWVNSMIEKYWQTVSKQVYDDTTHKEWTASVKAYHPHANHLALGAICFHARNYGIVYRATAVVALPSYERGGGGTAQGLRVAKGLGIKVYDLRMVADREELKVCLLDKGSET